jgi:hypothetical protein
MLVLFAEDNIFFILFLYQISKAASGFKSEWFDKPVPQP